MAISKLGAASTGRSADIVYVASITISHTVSAGSNRLLEVAVVSYPSGAPTANSRTVTWNGQSLTRKGIKEYAANEDAVEIWYLKEANLSTATADVVITAVSVNQQLSAVVQTWQDVDQTTPYRANSYDGSGVATTGSLTVVDSESSDTVTAVVGSFTAAVYTITADQTLTGESENNGAIDSINSESTTATGASTVLSWTFSESLTWWGLGTSMVGSAGTTPRIIHPTTAIAMR